MCKVDSLEKGKYDMNRTNEGKIKLFKWDSKKHSQEIPVWNELWNNISNPHFVLFKKIWSV